MLLEVTERAVSKVRAMLAAENKAGFGLRIAVQGGGCSGFQYGLTFDDKARLDDKVLQFDGLKVYVDAKSQSFLNGTTVDYIESLQGSGFKISNPNSTGSCGCGHSFSV
jgi:iron-sulfur cluster assembly accessory protein